MVLVVSVPAVVLLAAGRAAGTRTYESELII